MMEKCTVVFLTICLIFTSWKQQAEATRSLGWNYKVLPRQKVYNWKPGGLWSKPDGKTPISVTAHFDMNGVRGTIQFYQQDDCSPVTIDVNLQGLDQYEGEMWGWHVHERPINWALLEQNPCSLENVGDHYDPLNVASNENYTQNCANDPEECEVGDLVGRHGTLKHDQSFYWFSDEQLNLYGPHSIIGRSLVIHRTHGFRYTCANIEYDSHNNIQTYHASFPCNPKEQNPALQGEVIMRRSVGRQGVTLEARLYRVDNGPLGIDHVWSLWRANKDTGTCGGCSNLDHVIGTKTHNYQWSGCGSDTVEAQTRCPYGNLTNKCGPLTTLDNSDLMHLFCTDTQLGCVRYNYYGPYFIAVQDADGTVIGCSRFEPVQPRAARSYFRNGTILVDAFFYQYDPHDPTYLRFHARNLYKKAGSFQIREKPVTNDRCENLGAVYEPRFGFESLPETNLIIQTGDRDHLGELRNKVGSLANLFNFYDQIRNSYVPLFGDYTIIGKSLVLLDTKGTVIACGNITLQSPYTVPSSRTLASYH